MLEYFQLMRLVHLYKLSSVALLGSKSFTKFFEDYFHENQDVSRLVGGILKFFKEKQAYQLEAIKNSSLNQFTRLSSFATDQQAPELNTTRIGGVGTQTHFKAKAYLCDIEGFAVWMQQSVVAGVSSLIFQFRVEGWELKQSGNGSQEF